MIYSEISVEIFKYYFPDICQEFSWIRKLFIYLGDRKFGLIQDALMEQFAELLLKFCELIQMMSVDLLRRTAF